MARKALFMKASMFKGPLAPVFRKLGGIPVDRSGSFGLVDSVVREFEKNEDY